MLFSWKLNFRNNNDRENNFFNCFRWYSCRTCNGFCGRRGFLIIPALLLLTNISMKEAVGTSLLVIAIKSILGFTAELNNVIDWNLLLTFTGFSIVGILIVIVSQSC